MPRTSYAFTKSLRRTWDTAGLLATTALVTFSLPSAHARIGRCPKPPAGASSPPPAGALSEIDAGQHHHANVGVVLHRAAQALAANAGTLLSAVRHLIRPVAGYVADDHTADSQSPMCRKRGLQVVREYASLEAVLRLVDHRERRDVCRRLRHLEDRAEHLLATALRIGRCTLAHGRRDRAAIAREAADQIARPGRL